MYFCRNVNRKIIFLQKKLQLNFAGCSYFCKYKYQEVYLKERQGVGKSLLYKWKSTRYNK